MNECRFGCSAGFRLGGLQVASLARTPALKRLIVFLLTFGQISPWDQFCCTVNKKTQVIDAPNLTEGSGYAVATKGTLVLSPWEGESPS